MKERKLSIDPTEHEVVVTKPFRQSGKVSKVCRRCPLKIQGCEFLAKLMALTLHEFDVIFGMDWLSKHKVMIDCKRKRISLRTLDGKEVIVIGKKYNPLSNVVCVMKVSKMVRKGHTTFLACILDTHVASSEIERISIVRDFSNVIPEELLGLPPKREVQFEIKLVLGTTLISLSPYQMKPIELKELKTQLYELPDKRFVHPSLSPWGAPMLFLKKKVG